MKADELYDILLELRETLRRLPPSKLRRISRLLAVENDKTTRKVHVEDFFSTTYINDSTIKVEKEKQELIGSVPYILTHKKYFPTNQSVVSFAKQLGIRIPNWRKKKKDEILGRIITELIKFKPYKIRQFNRVIKNILGKAEKGEVSDFFTEWERAIKELRFPS